MTQHLVIRISDNSLSFTKKSDNESDVTFEPYDVKGGISIAANLREAFKTSALLGQSYDKVTVLIDSPTMVIPLDDFDSDEMEEQYRYVHPQSEGCRIGLCVLPAFRNMAVFGINKDLRNVICDHFGDTTIKPVLASVWDFLLKRSYGSNSRKLYAYFHDGKMDLCSFARNRFTFTNCFKVDNTDDTLYFILAAWKQVGGVAKTDELYLAGAIPDRDALIEKAKHFLSRVFCINPSADFNRARLTQNADLTLDLMLEFL